MRFALYLNAPWNTHRNSATPSWSQVLVAGSRQAIGTAHSFFFFPVMLQECNLSVFSEINPFKKKKKKV